MKIATAKEMAEMEERTFREYGISTLILMENAGLSIAEEVLALFKEDKRNKRILVIAGKGNNGGDGFVAARHLYNNNLDVRVFLLGEEKEIKGDAKVNFEILKKLGVKINILSREEDLQRLEVSLFYADVVIDAIFGTGFKGKTHGIAQKTIETINKSSKTVISVDLPSGMEADSGKVEGNAIKADVTVTFGLPKKGFFLKEGPNFIGKLIVKDISFPLALRENSNLNTNLLQTEELRGILPSRPYDGHKGTFGHLCIAGGSLGMTGAVALSANSALRSGCGVVTAAVPFSLNPILEEKMTEALTFPLREGEKGVIGVEAIEELSTLLKRVDALVLGPGLGRNKGQDLLLAHLLPQINVPTVLDADGLNALGGQTAILTQLKVPVILTPHPGEFSRLIGIPTAQIQENRIELARQWAMKWKVVLILKGAYTVVAFPEGEVYLNPTGNSGMATAGSGDVLSGIIGSFLAQGVEAKQAALLGVYLHGLAGDLALQDLGNRSIIAGDLVHYISAALKFLERNMN